MLKKVFGVLLGLAAAIWIFFAAVGVSAFVAERSRMNESMPIYTEAEPIYNHLPGLPETSEIEWCSRASGGIGLTTVRIYFFAFYDHDVSGELGDVEIKSQSEDMEWGFTPDGINGDESWRRVENAGAALQTGIRDTQKMATTVYINDAGNILYVEAIGE